MAQSLPIKIFASSEPKFRCPYLLSSLPTSHFYESEFGQKHVSNAILVLIIFALSCASD